MVSRKVGQNIQRRRVQLGLTQEELAQKLDISTKHMSAIERGQKKLKLELFVTIANALNCDANTLLSDVIDSVTEEKSRRYSDQLETMPLGIQRAFLRIIAFAIQVLKEELHL